MAHIQICGLSLKRVGDANYRLVELQDRATVPTLGDVIEVLLNKEPVRGRVVQVASSPLDKPSSHYGISYVDLDEVSRES
jgi:hypothetical protein